MTTEVLTFNLTGGVQQTAGQGRIFYVKTATSALNINAEQSGSGAKIRKFANVTAGFKFVAPEGEGWQYLRLNSALSQSIELIVGDDDVSVANAVSISGSVATQTNPSTTITVSGADTSIANASAFAIGANLSRRRITIGALAANTGNLRIQSTGAGAGGKGIELQPGLFVQLETSAAFDVRNDTGAAQSVWIFEES